MKIGYARVSTLEQNLDLQSAKAREKVHSSGTSYQNCDNLLSS